VTGSSKSGSAARERILEAADRLFYREGIRAVGIDTIIAEAGVAKMTLYAHFKSKDELIAAYLLRRDAMLRAWFARSVEQHAQKSGDWLAALFAALGEWFASPDFRGCAFINATAELPDPTHPGRLAVAEHNRQFTAFVVEVLRKARVKNPEEAVLGVGLVIDGAIVSAACANAPGVAEAAQIAVRKLLGRNR
jgi:AcrR family transcriptional regulator